MNNKYKLLLLCDHKWRDLPNLVVLKYYLNLLGHHVIICSTKDTKARKGFDNLCLAKSKHLSYNFSNIKHFYKHV